MQEQEYIRIRGARVHNLKNVDLDLPLRKLVCFAGPSGSGKTSLAFHTLLSESKRRFVNSFPNSMKFFADRPAAVDVDEIFPVLPVFGLPQINPVLGSRSVVADVMRVTDLLQGLYFNHAKEYCPTHDVEVSWVGLGDQLRAVAQPSETETWHLIVERELGAAILGANFAPPRSWSSQRRTMGTFDAADDHWEVLRFKASSLASVDKKYAEILPALRERPLLLWREGLKQPKPFSFVSQKKCPHCDYAGAKGISVNSFAPHTALGACKACKGYGANLVYAEEKMVDRDLSFDEDGVVFLKFGPLDWWRTQLAKLMRKKKWPTDVPLKKLPREFFKLLEDGEGDWEGFAGAKAYLETKRYKPAVRVFMRKMQRELTCEACQGTRLDEQIANFAVALAGERRGLAQFAKLGVSAAAELLAKHGHRAETHAGKLLDDLAHKLRLAEAMGLGHLQLSRKTRSLSAGEYQRLLLLKYLSFRGTDALFVLDEPSLGLGETEQAMLIAGLRELIAQGNTVLVIDHSRQMLAAADQLVALGPGSGGEGGVLTYQGAPAAFLKESEQALEKFKVDRSPATRFIEVEGAQSFGQSWGNFLVPLERLTWVHGPSGSGKTSCVVRVLAQQLHKEFYRENLVDDPGSAKSIKGHRGIRDVIVVDANLNRYTSRSSVGTLTEFAPAVRKHFLKLPVAKAMGLKDGHLSSNSELGMCPRCEGKGQLVIEMQYLEDIVLTCEDCKGKRLKPVYAEISDGTMSVAEAFNLPLNQVLPKIALTPKFKRTWEYLKILNLDYLSLERPLNSLSGGERQRLYLLSKLLTDVEESLLVFENLSFGLSTRELDRVGRFLLELTHRHNTLLVIDSDPYFAKLAQAQLVFGQRSITLK